MFQKQVVTNSYGRNNNDKYIYGYSANDSPSKNSEIMLDPILEAGEKGKINILFY